MCAHPKNPDKFEICDNTFKCLTGLKMHMPVPYKWELCNHKFNI